MSALTERAPLRDEFALLPVAERARRLASLSEEEMACLYYDWEGFWARPSQRLPGPAVNPKTESGAWTVWMIMAGRGNGKTRVGAETVRIWSRDFRLVSLVGATADDARDIMIEGESGILEICPRHERPVYESSKRKLRWPNGSKSLIFTADEPERLRGKQHMKAWADEIGSWRYDESWDQLMLGLRLGGSPQCVVTTTPRPTRFIKDLLRDYTTVVTHGTSYDNRENLSPAFYDRIIRKYEGTRLGRQELNAELLVDNPSALWTHEGIDRDRVYVTEVPELVRVVVGVDPAVTSKDTSDETGIVAGGIDGRVPEHYYVLEDASLRDTPQRWCARAVKCYRDNAADRLVAEVNNGGDLVEALLRTVDENVSYGDVHASRGKTKRAEPVAALYEQGRVHHVGSFAKLEDEQCDWDPNMPDEKQVSPNRMDALVWLITELASGTGGWSSFIKDAVTNRRSSP